MCFYPFGVSKIIKMPGVSSSNLISHSTLLNHLVYHFLLIIMALAEGKLSWNGSFRSLSESCIAVWSFWKLRKVRALSILLSHAWARWFGTHVTLISLNISMHTDQVVLDVFLLSHFVFLSIRYRFMVSEIKNLCRACLMTILPRKLLNYARERWTQIICINYLNYSQ